MFDFTQLSKSIDYFNSLKKDPLFTEENFSLLKEE